MADEGKAQGSVGLKDAALAAKKFLLELQKSGLLGTVGIKDVVLEEVAKTPKGEWLITLGYRQPSPLDSLQGGLMTDLRPQRSEFFKTFRVKPTGEVVAMNLREPLRG